MSLSKSVNLAHAQRPVPCDSCEAKEPGEYFCIECKRTLCPQCEKLHRKFTEDHNVVLRSQLGDIDTMTLSCADHDEQAIVHCEKCNIQVCLTCVTEKHQEHKMVKLTVVCEHKRKLLQNHIDEIGEFLPKLDRKGEDIESKKETYKMTILRITKEMEAENQSLHEDLDRLHNERLKRLNSIRQSHLLMFDDCTTEIIKKKELCEKRKSEYKDVIGKNSLPAIIKFVPKMESLLELGSEPELPVPPSFVPGNTWKVAENLGKLQLSHPSLVEQPFKLTTRKIMSRFQSPLKGWPSIFITKEGEVWLGGFESRQLVMVDITGQVLRTRDMRNRSYALAVLACGDVIISPHFEDSSSVSRLLLGDKEENVFDTSPYSSVGVSITPDQQILIGTRDGRVVRTLSDGCNVTELNKGDSVVYAVEYVDVIYISDLKKPAILVASTNGKVLSTITHTTGGKKLGRPLGLMMDKMGNVLWADWDNDCIYIIDQYQKIRELVGHEHGIEEPRWLAVDSENNLWITQFDGTIYVVKYLA